MFLLASFLTHWIPLNKLFCFDETFVLKICLLTFKTREKKQVQNRTQLYVHTCHQTHIPNCCYRSNEII